MSIFNSIAALAIGGGELFFVFLIALLFFGSKNIPELARSIGKGIREVRNATESVKKEIQDSANIDDETLNKVKEEVDKGKKLMEEAEGAVRRGMKS